MNRLIRTVPALLLIISAACSDPIPITTLSKPARLDVWSVSQNSLRITLLPLESEMDIADNPALVDVDYGEPEISLTHLEGSLNQEIGDLRVEISNNPLTVRVSNKDGHLVQNLSFEQDSSLSFNIGDHPILGMGEGGPRPGRDVEWRDLPVEYDRKGRFHNMQPRWQSNAYGSRNPVPFLIGTEGWGLFSASPWVQVDLRGNTTGKFIPWIPEPDLVDPQTQENQQQNLGKGLPPADTVIPGYWDLFVFDATDPAEMMKDIITISGQTVIPPKWALGYMQSHRTLGDENQIIGIVDSFREKEIPVDAVIYLGTGFCPQGWNEPQPSFQFNENVFLREPGKVIDDLHDRNVKVAVHIVPWDRDRLPTLHGTIPPKPEEELDESHIKNYWEQHIDLVNTGIDAFWPDEGDWFNLSERIKRHQLYYQGPLSTTPDVRPWSLHRNGYLGIGKWGGWVWSGDTQSAWKTLEAQIAVGINYSLSISPYWGSDIGGFYPNPDKTGEMYARWFQFGAFCPSFRSHGRTWFTALPWGFGLSDMGPREPNNRNDTSVEGSDLRSPSQESMNDPTLEPITKKYAELRYKLLPYIYSLSWDAYQSGMPLMRALWLHYPGDEKARGIGDEYLWGKDMLIAPVYKEGATSRKLYLPKGQWYDWWTNEKIEGGNDIEKNVDLSIMPIYVKAGGIIPMDPVRQYTSQKVDTPTTIRIYTGDDGYFTLYEDDGISQQYLEGSYTLTEFYWNDADGVLNIETSQNNSELKPRDFIIELLPSGIKKRIAYDYSSAVVQMQ